jgi:hypothetical protein
MGHGDKVMDLFADFRKTYETLRSNLLLFFPPLIFLYLVPVALGIAGVYVFVPVAFGIATAYAFMPVFAVTARAISVSVAVVGGAISAIILLVVAVVVYSAVFAGWGYMSRAALTNGKTSFEDFKTGFRNHFGRVIVATVITLAVPILLGLGALASVIAIGGRIRSPTLRQLSVLLLRLITVRRISNFTPAQVFQMIPILTRFAASSAVVVLFIATLAGIWLLFTLFWIPSIIVSQMGIGQAFANSVSFVRGNFYTVIGYVGILIIAVRFAATIFPGVNGIAKGYVLLNPPALAGVFQVLIEAFFVLLLYAIYIDRTTTKPRRK